MSRKDMTLRELEAIWYQKLKDEGFKDIEDASISDRPLYEWHSFLFLDEKTMARKAKRSEYQQAIELFINRGGEIDDIWESLVKHGNSTLTIIQVKLIWELHLEGKTERSIASSIGRTKTCIHLILERIRAWMNLV